MIPKGISQTLNQKHHVYNLEKEITISRAIFVVLFWKYESPIRLATVL
jgi:hypothetical protein